MENPDDRDFELWVLLNHSKDAVYKARGKEVRRLDITGEQAKILYAIHSAGDETTPAEIGRWILRESQTVSATIKKMEEKKLVSKQNHPKIKNRRIISLTEKGHKAYHELHNTEVIKKIFSCLTEEERASLISSLKKVRNYALKEAGFKGKGPHYT